MQPGGVRLFFSVVLAVCGVVTIVLAPTILKLIIRSNLILTPTSQIFEFWKHFPERVPIDFYFFNWTNPEKVYEKDVKPRFEEMGPYRFMVDLGKNEIEWHDNGTITFVPLKYYFYEEGNLEDEITNINPVAIAAGHKSRTWNYMVRRGLSITLSTVAPTIHQTHTVDELLFTGYPDTLSKMASTFPFFSDVKIPAWDRFGWFYQRNGTTGRYIDGVYNVGTGSNSVFGKLYQWNFLNKSSFYEGVCADIDGSTGENFNPDTIGDFIKIFSAELCRLMVLQYAGKAEVGGIVGNKYILGDYMLDNGTTYPEHKCSCGGDCLPIGVFNVSSCRFGSPSFGSLPHFHKADPYYHNLIEGMLSEKDKHDFYVVVEPNTGFPLQLRARLQINLMLHSIPGIRMYEEAPTAFIPVLWFDHHFDIPEAQLATLRILLKLPILLTCAGVFLILIAILLLATSFRNKKSHFRNNTQTAVTLHEEKKLLEIK